MGLIRIYQTSSCNICFKQVYNFLFHNNIKIEMNMRIENYQSHAVHLQEYRDKINQMVLQRYPMAVKQVNGQIVFNTGEEVEAIFQLNNLGKTENPKERGGNNASQNIKKSILAVIKKRLPRQVFHEFEQNFIVRYKLKSQKQNYLLFFLFLHIFAIEGKISIDLTTDIQLEVKHKIRKYIQNSKVRAEKEEDRANFHMKNIIEFQKYLEVNLEFTYQRTFQNFCQEIRPFYLRKKVVFEEAKCKIRRIISHHDVLKKIIIDWQQKDAQNERYLQVQQN